jgi:hypothetical protein
MIWDEWTFRWQQAIDACRELGGEAEEITRGDHATEAEVIRVERELGLRIPDSFRTVLLTYAARVEVYWALPEDAELPSGLQQIFYGNCSWDLHTLAEMNAKHKELLSLFTSEADPNTQLWHDKLVFQEVENGDRLVIDLSTKSGSTVVYLSAFQEPGHGYVLGDGFADFIDPWTRLGCPGPEIVQMLPFVNSPSSGLDPGSSMAKVWRKWFGLPEVHLL